MKSKPAFPVLESTISHMTGAPRLICKEEGISIRDYFAAKAVQGILSNQNVAPYGTDKKALVERAYAVADAMIEASKANP
jgi:hypothetical protein